MPIPPARTWFVTTSPRNPAKLRQELELLSRLDGKNWWEKDSRGQLIHQLQFAKLLAESEFFEGSISERYPELATRDRLRAPQMLGFAYVDEAQILHITPAGWQLISNERANELFLRQLLKWQFPSWQHGGNPRTRWRYRAVGVHPFQETLRVALELEGVTKDEIAIFLLPCLSLAAFTQAIPKIRGFRRDLAAVTGARPRKEFVIQTHLKELQSIYAEDIRKGRIGIRETPAERGRELEHFLNTKHRNCLDYADAAMRYFRYTGLFTQRGNRLVVSNVTDARRIINELVVPIRTDYSDPVAFYDYLGNPAIPQFPWEQPSELVTRLAEVRERLDELSDALGIPVPSLPAVSLDEQCRWVQEQLTSLTLEKRRLDWTPKEIDRFYDDILRRRVSDPPLFMEWNTWRVFLYLGHYCLLQPNFSLDLEWQPISHAGGRQPDIEVVFCGKYAVAVEVTLVQGERQYFTESEPVTRHVERFQEKIDLEVFGLFIAPTLHKGAMDWFQYNAKRKGISVLPLELEQFRTLLAVWSDGFRPEKLYGLLKSGRQACIEADDTPAWLEKVRQLVANTAHSL
ncbi:MAG: AlwI family type II restriction endonuclease [bacterium]